MIDVNNVPGDVLDQFERLAFEVIASGQKRYSVRAILHRLRWHYHIEKQEEFKCNNNWTSAMARWFMERHPEHAGFFETRTTRGGADAREADCAG